MEEIQAKALEDKLNSLLGQLDFEHAVFERMVYKNKNQHRRCSYFKYLLNVRRYLRLLRLANMEEILRSCFHVIYGTRSKQKIHVLENLKFKKSDTGKPNILERLLGALHLLSQMTELILKAASGISILLAQNFFRDFSLTFLALLARLRVLVQQVLVDTVSVYNSVTSLSVKKQSVKIAQEGVEVFREFYPKDEEFITLLECVWKTGKYVIVEKLQNLESRKSKEENVSEDYATSRDSLVQYQTFVSSLGEDRSPLLELHNGGVTAGDCLTSNTDNALQLENPEIPEDFTTMDSLVQYETSLPSLGEAENDGVAAIESSTPIAETISSKTEISEKPEDVSVSKAEVDTSTIKPCCRANKVAFLPVKRPSSAVSLNTIEEPPTKKQETGEKEDEKAEEDGFYNLLIRGTHKDSLF